METFYALEKYFVACVYFTKRRVPPAGSRQLIPGFLYRQ